MTHICLFGWEVWQTRNDAKFDHMYCQAFYTSIRPGQLFLFLFRVTELSMLQWNGVYTNEYCLYLSLISVSSPIIKLRNMHMLTMALKVIWICNLIDEKIIWEYILINLACAFVSLYVLIWRAHYIHIMMGFLYDVFFYVTLRYLSYATIIMHSYGIYAIGIYRVLFMKQYVTRNEQQL